MAAIAAEADLEENPGTNPATGSVVDPETFPDDVIPDMLPEDVTPDLLPEDVIPDVNPDVVPDENSEVPPEEEVRVDRSPLVDDARSSTIKKQSTVMVATYPQ